ncbi:esterase/lipase family protein [Azonexus sp.]|uniref:esterase/lipase family protein n=1 Tax=Azonexus sp. TaxID=1872668 RepID=UPI0039E2408C
MSALRLQLWLWLELGLYAYLGQTWFGWTPGRALLAGALFLLALRLGQSLATWGFSARCAEPGELRPRLGQILHEAAASLFTQLLVLPLPSLWMAPDRLQAGRPIVLLVHGYSCNRAVWWLLRRRLEAAGLNVATLNLRPPFGSMGRMVPLVAARIAALRQEQRNTPIILIGHSMGGLVCRSWLARYGAQKGHGVRRLITLASPNSGTALARFGFGQNSREMQPDSLWLQDLRHERPNLPVIALENPLDNFIMPRAHQRLTGADNQRTPPVGHLQLLYDREVAAQLIALCQK